MLCSYDDYSMAVLVFNHYGDIVYRNKRADHLTPGGHIRSISCHKLRLITTSLLNGLIKPPFCFHADMGLDELYLCHLHQHHKSYTLLITNADTRYPNKPRTSVFQHQFSYN